MFITSNLDFSLSTCPFTKPQTSLYSTWNALRKAYNHQPNRDIRVFELPAMAVSIRAAFMLNSVKQLLHKLHECDWNAQDPLP